MAQHTIIVESASQPAAQRKRRKAPMILAGIGLIALIPVVGSTFAANIALNGGDNIEFGQGNQAAVTCDSDGMTVTPVATFDPSGDSWSYQINVTGIAGTCDGKVLTVSTWSASAAGDDWSFTVGGTDPSGVSTSGDSATGFTATLTGGTLSAADLATITVESSN